MWYDPKEPENVQGGRRHSVLGDFKLLFQNASHYEEILSQVTNPGGRLHVKLSALLPLTKVNVPDGEGLS